MAVSIRPKDLEMLLGIFGRYPKILEVRIFGSRAKGSAKRASDIDLAVSAPAMTVQKWSQLQEDLEGAPIIFEYDLVRLDELPPGALREKILKEGKRIYPAS